MTPTKFAMTFFSGDPPRKQPFITGDKIADVLEQMPGEAQSNNLIPSRQLATPECASALVALLKSAHPPFLGVSVASGPIFTWADGDPEIELQHMTTSGPRTALWLDVVGFNKFNAPVKVHLNAGVLAEYFTRQNPEEAFKEVLDMVRAALSEEPTATGEGA